ncbi:MAG: nucleotidyl transferase AbiEii/AbiGii toxin family protein [Candidatus Marinimicrobia bacterium]|nr:nucleotidyl transferase AbiEii/AbiGii toxin family protein [Candidatus Neomarinimicrobiota bacterium]
MNQKALSEWLKLPDETKKNIFTEISKKTGLPAIAVEKDWWVVKTLEVVFNTDIADHTVFKGGTSLSKAWGLIERFSEDIDLALDRKFLGFDKEITGSQVKKLRQHSFKFISEEYYPKLEEAFHHYGLTEVELQLTEPSANDQDPLIIETHYPGLIENSDYIHSRVLIEIGSRSLKEPFTVREFNTMVGEHYPDKSFADSVISIPTVNPERTFLEKIFLLHEEFQKPLDRIKVDRLSRHLYDVEKLMDTEYAEKALSDPNLYKHLVEHRRTMTPVRGIDYACHAPTKINPVPPDNLFNAWKKDYLQMQENMIYGESLPFDKLLDRIRELKERINKIKL